MNEIAISRNQWSQFCKQFSHQHHGWPVSLHQRANDDPQTGQESAEMALYPGYRSLQEVCEGQQGMRIEIIVTVVDGMQETSFLIADAIAIYSRNIGETHQGLRIDSNNGRSTLLEFPARHNPEP
jgi:hypothetical protein